MKHSVKTVTLAILLALGGCAVTPSREALSVRDADAAMVTGCQYVGNVTGTSGWGGLASGAGIANARNEARTQAATLGANFVVWESLQNSWTPTVDGDAYRCVNRQASAG